MIGKLTLVGLLVGTILCAGCMLSAEKKTGAAPSSEIAFERLRITEVENQNRGTVRQEDAIPAQQRVFTDADCWRAFWKKHGIKAPDVDFRTNWAAAVFLGPKPDPGYGVQISSIAYDEVKGRVIMRVTELQPDPDMGYAAVVVYPGDVVVFRKSVEFEMERKVRTK